MMVTISVQVVRKCLYGNDINWVKTKDLEVRLSKRWKEKKEQTFCKDGGFYREQPKLINADWEEHADPRTRPNYRD